MFFGLNIEISGERIDVSIKDKINDYSFYKDPNTEVYIKEHKKSSANELMDEIHSGAMKNEMDHEKHMEMMKPDKSELLNRSIRLEEDNGSFTGNISGEWKNTDLIVFYGSNQDYYLTKELKLD